MLCTEPQPTSSPNRNPSVAEGSPVDEPQVGLSMCICSLVVKVNGGGLGTTLVYMCGIVSRNI